MTLATISTEQTTEERDWAAETNIDDLSDIDIDLLYDNLALRTACCHQVVPSACIEASCGHEIRDMERDDLVCVNYFENGYVFHDDRAECQADPVFHILAKSEGFSAVTLCGTYGAAVSQYDLRDENPNPLRSRVSCYECSSAYRQL